MSERKKVAYFDVDEVWLYWADKDDEALEEIEWPDSWGESVTVPFLIEQGFEIV